MVTRDDVESFLLRMDESVEEVEPGMWVVASESGQLVIHYSPPLLLLRAKVLEIPSDQQACASLFRHLLELNASDLIHGAYAIEEGDVILTETLELDHLGFDAFQGAIDSIQIALASHLESLAPYRDC